MIDVIGMRLDPPGQLSPVQTEPESAPAQMSHLRHGAHAGRLKGFKGAGGAAA
jgi:hypothetical protein